MRPSPVACSASLPSPIVLTFLRSRSALLLALLLVIAAALRVYQIDAESAWLDETFSIGIARDGIDAILYETSRDVHPPLYYFLLRGWVLLTGGAVWTARLLSVIFSLGVIAATFGVGRRLVGETAALVAAVLLTVSVFQIEFAQEARMYALLTLLATISTWSFIRLFDAPDRRWFALYVVATALMTYTQVYSVFIIAAQGLSVIGDVIWTRGASRNVLARWIGAQFLAFVAFLPWLPTFTWQVSHVQKSFWIPAPVSDGWFEALRTYTASDPLLYLMIGVGLIGIVSLVLRRDDTPPLARPPLFFLVPWMLGPILFPFALSFMGSPIFLPKYTIAASIPFTLIAAAGIARLPWRVAQAGVLITCVVLSARTLPGYYHVQTKDGWREATASIELRARPGDIVLVYPYFNNYAYGFYHQREDVTVRSFPLHTAPPPPDGWAVTIERATTGYDRFWLVSLASDPTAPVVVEQLRLQFDETSHEVVQKIGIYQFARRR